MSKRAESLYRLQRFDTRITVRKRRYDQVKANLGESEALLKARAALKSAQAELGQWQKLLRERELDVTNVIAKQKETLDLLYSGRVRNPKELSDLQKESEYLKRRRASLEETQLEAMIKVEELVKKAAVANEEYVVVEAAWRTENAELVQEHDDLKRELAQLIAKRKNVSKRIPDLDREEYNSLRKVRKGVAVSAVKNDTCQACHVQVPTRLIDKARDTDELIYCNGCDRILYVAG
jgi:predicted  nucleic acid-binding Zn-ribbon protein